MLTIDNYPHKNKWRSLLKALLCDLSVYDDWLFQNVGNVNIFLSFVKQRLNDKCVQNIVGSRIPVGHYIFYKSLCSFRFQSYLICVNIIKRIV